MDTLLKKSIVALGFALLLSSCGNEDAEIERRELGGLRVGNHYPLKFQGLEYLQREGAIYSKYSYYNNGRFWVTVDKRTGDIVAIWREY